MGKPENRGLKPRGRQLGQDSVEGYTQDALVCWTDLSDLVQADSFKTFPCYLEDVPQLNAAVSQRSAFSSAVPSAMHESTPVVYTVSKIFLRVCRA